jgi:post-segregation antitoxin (ccd killing protein)
LRFRLWDVSATPAGVGVQAVRASRWRTGLRNARAGSARHCEERGVLTRLWREVGRH